MRRFLLLPAAVLALLVVPSASAADPVRVDISAIQEQPGRIVATVSIFGPDGRPLTNVPSSSVRAALDGQSLAVSSVQSSAITRTPIGVVLLVDVSGSMQGDSITQARRALLDFTTSLDSADSAAVIAFDSSVRLIQDFTSNKTLMTQAINKLQPSGDTALYDAVIEAASRASQSSAVRKLIVLLTDGKATVGVDKRVASLDAAKAAGVPIMSIGLGKDIDAQYLSELASASGGSFLNAPTAAALRTAYGDLAQGIKAQYLITLVVPDGVDRSVPATLTIRVTSGTEVGTAERAIPPRPGALPPPIAIGLDGLTTGEKLSAATVLSPVIPAGIAPATVEYSVDGQSVYKASEAPFTYELDPSSLAPGNHVVKVLVTDPRGRAGQAQGVFSIAAPAKSHSFPILPLVAVGATAAVAGLAFVVAQRLRKTSGDTYVTRIKPWHGGPADAANAGPPPEFQKVERPAAQPEPESSVLGRVIVMNEAAVRDGDLTGIREFEIGTSPLSFGSSQHCDIVAEDPEDRIAGEEARLWVQRGRLVYHKLTTLSAMATEGVTSGWQFIEDGEQLRVGPYRIAFRAAPSRQALSDEAPPEESPRLHELWPRFPQEPDKRLKPSPDF